jgi:uncharacterized protein (TIGR03083 family)
MTPKVPAPILTAHVFATLDSKLIELLRSLSPDEWDTPTIAGPWRVRDVAAHLLDTALRRLSFCRDGFQPGPGPAPDETLVVFINRLNAEGAAVYRRLSPALLIAMTELATKELSAYLESLDPFAPAPFPVSWAGEDQSANWFDTARELTERWHHQQQIRLAVNKPGIETPELYHPVLDCFMRALPFAYRTVERPQGTLARFIVSGPCGGSWHLLRDDSRWVLVAPTDKAAASHTTIPESLAWRIFTKGIPREDARSQVRVEGDETLGLHVLNMVSIVG